MSFNNGPELVGQISAGAVRALAVTTGQPGVVPARRSQHVRDPAEL